MCCTLLGSVIPFFQQQQRKEVGCGVALFTRLFVTFISRTRASQLRFHVVIVHA